MGHWLIVNKQTYYVSLCIAGWAAFGKLNHILKEDLSIYLKCKVFNQYILPFLLYGMEAVTLILSSPRIEEVTSGNKSLKIEIGVEEIRGYFHPALNKYKLRKKNSLADYKTDIDQMCC